MIADAGGWMREDSMLVLGAWCVISGWKGGRAGARSDWVYAGRRSRKHV